MTESKNHHFVPRWYLRNFASDANRSQINVFNKENGVAFDSSIEKAGSENQFNTVVIGENKANFEKMYDKVDSDAHHVIKKILETKSVNALTDADRKTLSAAVLVQIYRVKINRTTLTEMGPQLQQVIERFYGKGAKPDLTISDERAKLLSLMSVVESLKLAPEFVKKDLLLTETTDTPLCTSDNPVFMNNTLYGELGFLSRGIEVHWPISTTMMLSFLCPSIKLIASLHSPQLVKKIDCGVAVPMNSGEAATFNVWQVLNSTRFVYSSSNDFAFAKDVLEKEPDRKHVKSRVSLGNPGEPQKNMAVPEGKWVLIDVGIGRQPIPFVDYTHSPNFLEPMVIRVVKVAVPLLKKVVEHGPHTRVEIYIDQIRMGGMQSIRLEIDPNDNEVLLVHQQL